MSALPENIEKAPLRVRHRDLKRWSDSIFKSVCPVCSDGLLVVMRNQKTCRLEEFDNCVSCGQRVLYEDIEALNALEGRVSNDQEKGSGGEGKAT